MCRWFSVAWLSVVWLGVTKPLCTLRHPNCILLCSTSDDRTIFQVDWPTVVLRITLKKPKFKSLIKVFFPRSEHKLCVFTLQKSPQNEMYSHICSVHTRADYFYVHFWEPYKIIFSTRYYNPFIVSFRKVSQVFDKLSLYCVWPISVLTS